MILLHLKTNLLFVIIHLGSSVYLFRVGCWYLDTLTHPLSEQIAINGCFYFGQQVRLNLIRPPSWIIWIYFLCLSLKSLLFSCIFWCKCAVVINTLQWNISIKDKTLRRRLLNVYQFVCFQANRAIALSTGEAKANFERRIHLQPRMDFIMSAGGCWIIM